MVDALGCDERVESIVGVARRRPRSVSTGRVESGACGRAGPIPALTRAARRRRARVASFEWEPPLQCALRRSPTPLGRNSRPRRRADASVSIRRSRAPRKSPRASAGETDQRAQSSRRSASSRGAVYMAMCFVSIARKSHVGSSRRRAATLPKPERVHQMYVRGTRSPAPVSRTGSVQQRSGVVVRPARSSS